MSHKSYSIAVIGAGAGGLVIAIGAARARKKIVLIEKGTYGGDCTNYGCIPSKSLLASGHAAATLKQFSKYGLKIESKSFQIETSGALSRVRGIVEEVRSHETPDVLKKYGIDTITGEASFKNSNTLKINGELVVAKNIVIATGSSPYIPNIKGLNSIPFLTNETIFNLEHIPKHLIVIGGGPIGCELSQAFLRLGSYVSLIHLHPELLNKEEPETQQLIANCFEQEGMKLHLGSGISEILFSNETYNVILNDGKKLQSDALLISAGRKANLCSLNLEAAGIHYKEKGISVDSYGRTNIKHIWAVGDVLGPPFFTHLAENQARSVLTSLLLPFPFKKKLDRFQAIPRVTYTDPEIASIGLSEKEAAQKYTIATYYFPMSQLDRAITSSQTNGFIKVITKKWSSKILGCTIVSDRAGEILSEVSLAMKFGIPLRKLAGLIHPYPTYSLAVRKVADMWLSKTIIPFFLRKNKLSDKIMNFLPISIICLGMLTIYLSGIYRYLSFDGLREYHYLIKNYVKLYPLAVPVIFCIVYVVATALSIPGGIFLSLLGGYLFPQPLSTLYVLFSATLGATLVFLSAKTAFEVFFREKIGPFLEKFEEGFKKNTANYLLFLRFVPLFPFWVVNIAPAFFGVSLKTFIWTTFIGILPGVLVFTVTGAGLEKVLENNEPFTIHTIFNLEIRLGLLFLGIVTLIPIFKERLWDKFR